MKFDLRHFHDIKRLAIVGETKWERGMAAFCRPFTTAKSKYFDHARLEAAREWVLENWQPLPAARPAKGVGI